MHSRRATFILLSLAFIGQPGNSMLLYRIKDWESCYEVGDAAKIAGPLKWVATPTKHEGVGFRRVVAQRDRSDLFAGWNLIIQIAAKLPRARRGMLVDSDGMPLDAEALSLKTGWPEVIFGRVLTFFSDPKQGWLTATEVPDQSAPPAAPTSNGGSAPEASALSATEDEPITPPARGNPRKSAEVLEDSSATGQDTTVTGQYREATPPSSSSPPASNDAPGLPGIEATLLDRNDPVPFAEVVALFNGLCPSLPRCRLNDDRKKVIRARWLECQKNREEPMPWFRALFSKTEASDFLSGRKPSPNSRWRCGFDWIVGPKNAPKVAEGNYDNREGDSAEVIGKRSSMAG